MSNYMKPANPIQKGYAPNLTRHEPKSRNRHKPIVIPLDKTRAIVGPDVSRYQNDIDWVKMVETQKNMGFAMCRATMGKNGIDSKFKYNITQMRKTFSTDAANRTFVYMKKDSNGQTKKIEHSHKVAFGVYHYANILPTYSDLDYQQQADFFYNTVANAVNNNIQHFPNFWVLDWEDPNGHTISQTDRAKYAKVFVQRLHSKLMNKSIQSNIPSYVPKIFIYSGYYYWGNNVKIDTTKWFTTYGPKLWMASYTTRNGALPETDPINNFNISQNINTLPSNRLNLLNSLGIWIVWQYTSSASVPGISSRCDVSVVRNPSYWHSNFYQTYQT